MWMLLLLSGCMRAWSRRRVGVVAVLNRIENVAVSPLAAAAFPLSFPLPVAVALLVFVVVQAGRSLQHRRVEIGLHPDLGWLQFLFPFP
jgi:hypothetical protein